MKRYSFFRPLAHGGALACMMMFAAWTFAASNELDHLPFPTTWQAALDQLTGDNNFPGTAIIIHSPEWGTRVGVSGFANIETQQAPTPDNRFRVGSVSKVFTANIILQMEQEGLLRLTDLANSHLPGELAIPADRNGGDTTIRHLLQMSSGLDNYLDNDAYKQRRSGSLDAGYEPIELLEWGYELDPIFAPGQTYANPYAARFPGFIPEFPPFEYWWYTNTNYAVLGFIAEQIDGRPFHEIIQTRIFDKIGMEDSSFALDASIPDNMMRGYTMLDWDMQPIPGVDDWIDVTEANPTAAWAAGSVISTPWDLLHFARAIFTEETLIHEATRRKWFRFVSADIHWKDMEYGVGGLMQSHRFYGDLRGHGGAINGYKTMMWYMPDTETFIVFVVNTWDDDWEVRELDVIMPLVVDHPMPVRPALGQRQVALDEDGSLTFEWNDGLHYGDWYEFYLSANPNAIDPSNDTPNATVYAAPQERSYTVPNLQAGVEYFWRVDAVAGGTVFQGPVRNFTAVGPDTVIDAWRELE